LSGCSGHGEAIGHAGELLQGALRLRGEVEPFLITLPAPCLRSDGFAEPAEHWSIAPLWRTKALRAARIAAGLWYAPHALAIRIESSIPVARGFGSSTADCVAAVRAVAQLMNRNCAPAELASIVQQAEGASDSTMFGLSPVIFLPERGAILESLEGDWPCLHVTAFDLGGPPIDTLAHQRPCYTEAELDEFAGLLQTARGAFAQGDAEALGRAATGSATIQQRHCPHPQWPDLLRLASRRGAHGIAISHSGTSAALLSEHPIEAADSIAYTLSGNEREFANANPTRRRR
jgi:uncharacterized protein involved in propanediol utilization